jgi:type II secretory pathway component PulF
MKMRLPWPTIMLIRASSFVSHYWWILAIILSGLVISQMYWLKRDSGRRFWDRFKLKCPLLGEVALKVAISRFSRTLGVLLASGVSIVEALELAERVTGNTVIERVVNDAKDAVSRGDSIASSLGRGGVFPPIVICMIAAGEQSGGIEEGLFRIADIFDSDVEAKLSTMTSLLEPVMIIVLGVVVGFIVLAVLLPIFDINKAIV